MARRAIGITIVFALLLGTAVLVFAWSFGSRFQAEVCERFRHHRWRIASKVYSDTYLLYPGIDVEAADLRERLQELGYEHEPHGPLRPGTFSAVDPNVWRLHLRAFPPWREHPQMVRLELAGSLLRRIADDATGSDLPTLELEPALLSGLYAGEWEERRLVSLEEVPPLLVHAILDAEDRRFFHHHGIDVYGILRAAWANIRAGRVVEGGSTLTQQLMKNFFLDDQRTLRRKLQEAAMAFCVERCFSKEDILEHYLNEIYLGQRGAQAIHGVWEAAQFYFGKRPDDLTAGEIALIAGLIRGPNLYSPYRGPQRALRRRNYVLEQMFRAGHLDEAAYEQARNEPLRLAPYVLRTRDAPYFSDFVRQQLARLYPPEILFHEGLRVFTTLDLHLQRIAEDAVDKIAKRLEAAHSRLRDSAANGDPFQLCLLAVQPQTGFVRAMVGGRDYRVSQFNRCTQALRQPGSVFKPLVYAAALQATRHSPHPILPTTHVEDAPFVWHYDGKTWSPTNDDNRYLGLVTVRTAIEQSLNAATARVGFQIGLGEVISMARQLGVESPLPAYPALVLGAAEVSPFEVAQAYSVFANGGLRTTPLAIRRVTDRTGISLERQAVEVEKVLPADTAFLMTHLLAGVLDRGTASAARRWGFMRPAAGKTGTTDDYQDAWFVGYTPELLAVVWVGFDNQKAIGLSGARAALPFWVEFIKRATAGLLPSEFVPPPSVRLVRIDPDSGKLASEACPDTLLEAFYADQVPTETCPLHGAPVPPDILGRLGIDANSPRVPFAPRS